MANKLKKFLRPLAVWILKNEIKIVSASNILTDGEVKFASRPSLLIATTQANLAASLCSALIRGGHVIFEQVHDDKLLETRTRATIRVI